MIITTTDTLENREITEYLGLVCSRTINAKAGIGKAGQKAAETTVKAMTDELTTAASELGADAIVGLKIFPESATMFGVGTAVKIK